MRVRTWGALAAAALGLLVVQLPVGLADVAWEWKLPDRLGQDRWAQFDDDPLGEAVLSCAMALRWAKLETRGESFKWASAKKKSFKKMVAVVGKGLDGKLLATKSKDLVETLNKLGRADRLAMNFFPSKRGKWGAAPNKDFQEVVDGLEPRATYLLYLYRKASQTFHVLGMRRIGIDDQEEGSATTAHVFDPYEGRYQTEDAAEIAARLGAAYDRFDRFVVVECSPRGVAPKHKAVRRLLAENPVFVWSPSMEHLSSNEQVRALGMFAAARQLLGRAEVGVQRAKLDEKEHARFERWFGPYDADRHEHVGKVLRSIHRHLQAKKVQLYFRGEAAKGKPQDSVHERLVENHKTIQPDDGFAYINDNEASKELAHIYLGEKFLTGPHTAKARKMSADAWRKQKPDAQGYTCPGGTLIHELTHLLARTDDVEFKKKEAYGTDVCIELAQADPDLALKNADNYEFYCESFWLDINPKLRERVLKDGEIVME